MIQIDSVDVIKATSMLAGALKMTDMKMQHVFQVAKYIDLD